MPFDGDGLLGFLAARAVPGIESPDRNAYRRVLTLRGGAGIAELTLDEGGIRCRLRLEHAGDADEALARCRRLLDLDTDPAAIAAVLAGDEVIGLLVRARPGLRVPRAVDGFELAVRAVVGQQVSVAGARTTLGRIVSGYGRPLSEPVGELTHEFPTATALAGATAAELPMPRIRAEALRGLARAVASGALDLDPGGDRKATTAGLLAIRGIGPWTAGYVAMRALGDSDVFLPTDVGVARRLERLGQPGSPAELARLAERWRPWRSYAVVHLWTPSRLAATARASVRLN